MAATTASSPACPVSKIFVVPGERLCTSSSSSTPFMPGMKGVELLEEVHKRSPGTTKILLTGQAGLDAVVAAINKAGLNRYIPTPWDEAALRLTVENLLKTCRLDR